jgi:hypothetical protein
MLKFLPYWDKVNHDLSEIYQSVEIKFSFATVNDNNEVTRCHDWVKCRDFLGDVIMTAYTDKKTNIFGFSYNNKKNPPIDKQNTTLLLKFPNDKTRDFFLGNQFLLDKYNKINHLSPTSYIATEDPLVYLSIGDPFWQKNFVTISVYTFLMKCMGYNVQLTDDWKKQIPSVDFDSPESRYIRETGGKLDILLENCYNIFVDSTEIHGYENSNVDEYQIHNNSGFYTMLRFQVSHNTLQQRYYDYVANTTKAVKRVRKSSKKLATPVNAPVLATAAS